MLPNSFLIQVKFINPVLRVVTGLIMEGKEIFGMRLEEC